MNVICTDPVLNRAKDPCKYAYRLWTDFSLIGLEIHSSLNCALIFETVTTDRKLHGSNTKKPAIWIYTFGHLFI